MEQSTDTGISVGTRWMGIGKHVETLDVREACKVSELDYTVSLQKAWVTDPQDPEAVIASRFSGIVNTRSNRVYGMVSDNYQTFQNQELFDMAGKLPGATMESAFSTNGGAKVCIMMKLGSYGLGLMGGDKQTQYVGLGLTHDGQGSIFLNPWELRMRCTNINSVMFGSKKLFKVNHSQTMAGRIEDLTMRLSGVRSVMEEQRQVNRQLVDRPMTTVERREFFLGLYEKTIGQIPANPATKGEKSRKTRAETTLCQWLANVEDPRNTDFGIQGTAWAAYNAVTQWSDHEKATRDTGEGKESSRLASKMFGSGAAFKKVALKEICGVL